MSDPYATVLVDRKKGHKMSLVVTKENFQQVREQGIGNGFTVLNPEYGYRKDNRLWFGECSECGERVTNSSLTGKGWEHTITTVHSRHASGTVAHATSYTIDYCPKA